MRGLGFSNRKDMKMLFKIIGLVLICFTLLILGLALFSWLRYGPVALFGHKGTSITLPYRAENEPMTMLPLGEKEEVHPSGHPGIDFKWDYAAPLIATFDGTISRIEHAKDMGEPVLYVSLKNGEYTSVYKELDSVGPGITKGAHVLKGDIIGYPHGYKSPDAGAHIGYQLHWEFGYDSFPGFIRLCPLTYFDPEALTRINALWEKTRPGHRNPTGQMICNGEYYGKDK